jgi:hypothetical protein
MSQEYRAIYPKEVQEKLNEGWIVVLASYGGQTIFIQKERVILRCYPDRHSARHPRPYLWCVEIPTPGFFEESLEWLAARAAETNETEFVVNDLIVRSGMEPDE